MAKFGLKWMDSDMHLCEPVDLWDDYIDPQFKEWLPRWSGEVGKDHPLRNRGTFVIGDETPAAETTPPPDNIIRERRFPTYEPYMCSDGSHVDPAGQLRAMETEGIDVAILFPTFGNRG